MSELTVDEFLTHHGVKGMRWGERNNKGDALTVVKSGTAKVAKFAKKHQKGLAITALAAPGAINLVKEGKVTFDIVYKVYKLSKAADIKPEQLALGRQIVQGLVLHSDEALTHHGVKGMRWGERRGNAGEEESSKNERHASRVSKTENQVKLRVQRINNVQSHIKDVNDHGINAELLVERHGVAERMSPTLFKKLNGRTQEEVVSEHKQILANQLKDEQHALLAQQVKLKILNRHNDTHTK
jgi:hypothetical protein